MWRTPELYWPPAHRHTGSMTLTRALKENMGDPERESFATVRNEPIKGRSHKRIGAGCFQEVGPSHISDEVPVMGMERRAWVISVMDSTPT